MRSVPTSDWSIQPAFQMPGPLGPALTCSWFLPSGPLPHWETPRAQGCRAAGRRAAGRRAASGFHLQAGTRAVLFSNCSFSSLAKKRPPSAKESVVCYVSCFLCFVFTSLSKVSLCRRSYGNSDIRAHSPRSWLLWSGLSSMVAKCQYRWPPA